MEAAERQVEERELGGEKASRIVEAMRTSVAERGIAGSTFDHVAREAGVSRGLLHYYFGTKERLLVEVVRRDTEMRVELLDGPLTAARTVDDILDALVASLEDTIESDPGYYLLVFEVFAAGRRTPEVSRELEELFLRTRSHVVDLLRGKQADGVISPRFDVDGIVAYMFAVGEGYAFRRLAFPADGAMRKVHEEALRVAIAAARYLLTDGA